MMVPLTFLATFETIGSIVGILITLITFVTLITKRPIQAFRNMVHEESKAANSDLKEQIEKVDQQMKENFEETSKQIDQLDKRIADNDQTDICMLRNDITHIYYKYKDTKKIPNYEKQNVMLLWERYDAKKGNHYVKSIIKEMEQWEEI